MVFNEINTNHKGRGGKQYLPIHGTGAKKPKAIPQFVLNVNWKKEVNIHGVCNCCSAQYFVPRSSAVKIRRVRRYFTWF